MAGYDITQPAISKWPEAVPALRQIQIEKITGGALKADQALLKSLGIVVSG